MESDMVHILGKTDVVFFGPREKPQAVRWWAENGMICYEDSRTGEYDAMIPKEFLLRLNAISDMISNGKTVENQGFMRRDDLARHVTFLEQGTDLVRKAKAQGNRNDPKVREQLKAARPVTIIT